jgi:hypothetical protein
MQKKAENEEFSEAETRKRMDDAVRRALATPHKPHAPLKAKKKTSRASRTRANAAKDVRRASGQRK